MAIAFDVFSSGGYVSNNPRSWTHTPAGTPKGVIVFVMIAATTTDQVTGVTYGGEAMSEVAGSPQIKATGETSAVHCFFLGSGIPSGAQTVEVTKSGDIVALHVCYTVTASGDTEVQDTTIISSDSLLNPSGTLSLGGSDCFCAEIFHSGAPGTASITPFANWTGRIEQNLSTASAGSYSYDIIDSADVTMGWTAAADDANCIGIAVKELPVAGGARSHGYIF